MKTEIYKAFALVSLSFVLLQKQTDAALLPGIVGPANREHFLPACEDLSATLYVDASRATDGDGSTWATAFKDLNAALAVANACTEVKEIKVAQGTYRPTATEDKTISFSINRAGLKIIGGYPTGGGVRNHRAHTSVLDGVLGEDVIMHEPIKSYHLITIVGVSGADSLVVDGFELQNCYAGSASSTTINGTSVPNLKGGGMYVGYNTGNPPVAVRNCSFTNSRAANGGALFIQESSVTLHSNRFLSNYCSSQGSCLYVYKGAVTIANSLFSKNAAEVAGGAITFEEATAATILNSTFYGNYITATQPYGGAINSFDTKLTIRNSIFSANKYGGTSGDPTRTSSDIFHNDNSTLAISNSIMQSTTPYISCSDCLPANTDPKFTNTSEPLALGFRLLAGSQAIDKGDNSQLPSYIANDVHGSARIIGGLVDMGAFESATFITPLSTLYVNESLTTGNNNGSTWADAFTGASGLAHALLYARTNSAVEEIWAAKGTYYPTSRPDNLSSADALDPNNAFSLVDGVKVYGGFPTIGGNSRDHSANPTILSGDHNRNDTRDEGDAYHVIVNANLGAETELNGFTITGGYTATSSATTIAVDGYTVDQSAGGGMYSVDASLKVSYCTFYKNESRGTGALGGGGMFYANRKPTLESVVFRENEAVRGGAMFVHNAMGRHQQLVFEDNTATEEGGAIFVSSGATAFGWTIFRGNSAKKGGAISLHGDTPDDQAAGEFHNSLFVQNTASEKGGVLYYGAAGGVAPVFVNNTFWKDVCTDAAGGNMIYYYNNAANEAPKFYNGVIVKAGTGVFYAGETSDKYVAQYNLTNYTLPTTASISDNIVASDLGLINVDDPAGDDDIYGTYDDGLMPALTSQAVNGGFNEFLPDEATGDLPGFPRTNGPFVDMGAYETYQSCEAITASIAKNGDEALYTYLDEEQKPIWNPTGGCRTMGVFTALNAELQNGYLHVRVAIDATTPSYGGHPYLRRHYEFEPEVDSDNHKGRVTLYFNPSDFLNYNANRGSYKPLPTSATDDAKTNLRIWQWHGTSTTHTPGSYTKNSVLSTGIYINPDDEDIVWNESLRRWEITFEFSGFSGFFVTTLDPSALPVTLSSFTVSAKNAEPGQTHALLNWSTAFESNSKHFVIERSALGKTWLQIGEVLAGGNAVSTKSYTYTDEHPLPGNNLYRLKMVDLDGTYSYSSIRSLHFEYQSRVFVYPNPVTEWLHISTDNDRAVRKIVIRDVTGKLIRRFSNVSGSVSVKDLLPGTYLVELIGNSEILVRQKVVVARQ